MASIENIFSLIQVLSKSEKRYFRVLTNQQKGRKNYMRLFEFLERRNIIDEAFHHQLRKNFPGKSLEPARKHLYRVLMKALRQFEAQRDIEALLMNLLQDSRILYNKGQVKLSFDQLEKVKQKALKHEKFMFYILAGQQELQYLVHLQFVGINEYQLLEKQNKITELHELEKRINQHSMLYEVLLLRYWKNGMVRSQKDVIKLNDLLLEEHRLLNSLGNRSFEARQRHLHFQSRYFQMTGNPQSSLSGFYDLDILFQENQHLWKSAPLYYFQLISGILSNLRWMEQYDEMDFFIARLKTLSASESSVSTMARYRMIEHLLNSLVDQGLYHQAEFLLKTHTPLQATGAFQLPARMLAQWIFTLARVHFGLGNYSQTLKLLNIELNHPVSSRNQSLEVHFLIMNLQVNALLKNDDYLVYAIRSVERKLKAERKLFGVEQLIISLLKRQIGRRPFKGYEEKLEKLTGNPYEHQLIKELCVQTWIRRMEHL